MNTLDQICVTHSPQEAWLMACRKSVATARHEESPKNGYVYTPDSNPASESPKKNVMRYDG